MNTWGCWPTSFAAGPDRNAYSRPAVISLTVPINEYSLFCQSPALPRNVVPRSRIGGYFTYLLTAEIRLRIPMVLDLYSRRVVGRSMQAPMTTQLATAALTRAIGVAFGLVHSCVIPIAAVTKAAISSSDCWTGFA